jgi:hypothetical protein
MGEKNLIIFIDSLPYFDVGRMKFLSQFKGCIRKVLPGFGYSINVKAEIFGGYVPDSVGYLNEWTYNPHAPLRKYHKVFRALRKLRRIYCLDRVVHKVLSMFLGQNLQNIPFEYLPFFTKTGIEAYRDEFAMPTIFSGMENLKKVCYYHYHNDKKRDYHVYSNTMKAISDQTYDNIFAAFGDLDGVTHEYGVGSEEYNKKVEELDNYLCQMYKEFSSKNPKGSFLLISDHGMANVNKSVDINMEKEFGRAGEDTYLYFIDSTMLRVWAFDERKKSEIEKYLKNLGCGKVLNRQERINYGITSKTFGNIIFLLNEGVVFSPSFMGHKAAKAMHGYSSEYEKQAGLCLSMGKNGSVANLPPTCRTIELYDFLKSRINISS